MPLTVAAVACLLTALTLEFCIIRPMHRRRRAEETRDSVVRMALIATLHVASLYATTAALVFTLVATFVATLAGVGTILVGARGLDALVKLHEMVEQISKAWAALTAGVGFVAMVVVVRRSIAGNLQRLYGGAIRHELERLSRLQATGGWKPMPSTNQMRAVETEMERLVERYARLAIGPERDATLKQIEELQRLWLTLDLNRRLDPDWRDAEEWRASSRQTGWREWFVSLRLFAGIGRVSGALAIAALALQITGLIGVAAIAAAPDLERTAVRLSDFVVARQKADAARAKGVTADRAPAGSDDERAMKLLAHRFERAVAREMVGAPPPPADGVKAARNFAVREAILRHTRTRADGVDVAHSDLGDVERHAADAYGAAEATEGPTTSIGERLRSTAQHEGVFSSPQWPQQRDAILRPEAVTIEADELATQMAGAVFDLASGATPVHLPQPLQQIVTRMIDEHGKPFFDRLVTRYVNAATTALLQGRDPAALVQEVLAPHWPTMTVRERTELAAAGAADPSVADMAAHYRADAPRLAAPTDANNEAMSRELRQAFDQAPNVVPPPIAFSAADELATYDDFFPSRSAASDSPRINLLNSWRDRVASELPEFAGAVSREVGAATSAQQLFSLAADVIAMEGYARVGGVVLGRSPTVAPTLARFTDIAWTRTGDDLDLRLVRDDGSTVHVGRFSRDLVRRTLAYVADDRRVAVTMVLTRFGRKTLLHPAFVGSHIGDVLTELDTFVDTFALSRTERTEVENQIALYNFAYSALANDTIGDATELEVPARRALQRAGDLSNPRLSPLTAKKEYFAPALVASILRCATNADVDRFRSCIVDAAPPLPDRDVDAYAESGVRERPYVVDDGLKFLTSDDRLWPFRFVIQTMFRSQPLDSADHVAVDRSPWEFQEIGGRVQREVGAATSAGRPAQILAEAQRFMQVERLFRSALDGALGKAFRTTRLVDLADAATN
jgi:hypothetical protein